MYLHNWQTGTATYLPVATHGGSAAFANPTVTSITSPSGKPAVVGTLFVPSEGAAPGQAGQLVYYREYLTVPTPVTGLSATDFDNSDFTGSTLVRVLGGHQRPPGDSAVTSMLDEPDGSMRSPRPNPDVSHPLRRARALGADGLITPRHR